MAKVLQCRDVGVDCDIEVRGETEQEILQAAGQHAQTVHSMEVTCELAAVRQAINDE